jgi:putative iron-dependent peroxidase
MPTKTTQTTYQSGIFAHIPTHARYLRYTRAGAATATDLRVILQALAEMVDGEQVVLGLGPALLKDLQPNKAAAIADLHAFTAPAGSKVAWPHSPADLWLWLRAAPLQGAGHLLALGQQLHSLLHPAFELLDAVDAFRHMDKGDEQTGVSRDLTGYEDGTENPKGRKALAAAFAADGSSFVAVQLWQHRWARIHGMSQHEQNHAFGRERASNKEIEDAPENAHIKRTTQEDFTLRDGSEGFSWRRSMPWMAGGASGLHFVSFGKSFEAFELQLRHMSGADDGITDALLQMSQPLRTSYYWCPPMQGTGRQKWLDLSFL